MVYPISKLLLPMALALTAPLAFAHSDGSSGPQQDKNLHETMREHIQPPMRDENDRNPIVENKGLVDVDRPDAWVVAKIKAQFAASDIVDASDIDIDVEQGSVRLTGTVSGDVEEQEALRLARTTEGVVSVDSSGLVQAASTAADAREMEED